MSFASAASIAKERGIDPSTLADESIARDILAEAIKKDCADGVRYLHAKVHEADKAGHTVLFVEDPNSALGKQIARLFAAPIIREIVKERFLHGREIVFYNCCSGQVPAKDEPVPEPSALMQLQMQAGPIAYSDC
jgi:hypothetical protein